jgi:hypothetical protein
MARQVSAQEYLALCLSNDGTATGHHHLASTGFPIPLPLGSATELATGDNPQRPKFEHFAFSIPSKIAACLF